MSSSCSGDTLASPPETEDRMLLKMIICVILIIYTSIFVTGAPNVKLNVNQQDISQFEKDVQRLISCKLGHQYSDLANFCFLPRSVPVEDTACLSLQMFKDMGFVDHFNIPVDILSRFILLGQKGYRDNPYHNWSHAFAVLHFSFAALKNLQLIEKQHFTPLEGLALLTASMCHDIDHPGTNNQFQIEINSSLAQKFADQGSILERHHIEVTLKNLRNRQSNFVAHLDEKNRAHFEGVIKHIILATDLSVHFKILLQEKVMATAGFDKDSDEHRKLLQSILITCADLSDQSKTWATVRDVAKLINREFFTQGDQERQLGLVPSDMMDRSKANIPPQQVDFISKVAIPVYNVLLILYPETQTCMDNLQRNSVNWKKVIPYFEDQQRQGRDQLDILSDTKLDNVPSWTAE